ncbi:MAG: hypothetical protein C4532_11855, partial [Candidatus Abyssobacteria bacterium SURF_17]
MASAQVSDRTTDPSAEAESCAKMNGSAAIADALIMSFVKAKKNLMLYPASNPVVAESISNLLDLLQRNFAKENTVEIYAEKDRLSVNGVFLGAGNAKIRELCLSLYRRGVKKIIFDPAISFEETKILLTLFNMKPEEIAKSGGIGKLTKCRGLIGAVVEETGDLAVVDGGGLSVSDDVMPEIEGLEAIELLADGERGLESLNRVFIRVEKGDLEGIKRLRALLQSPELFARLLEKFAMEVHIVDGDAEPLNWVERMLDILNAVGTAIASLPTGDERAQLMHKLALSVLGLSVTVRTDLVGEGLVPKLSLRNVEAGILSRFPVADLRDALLADFEVSGGAASVMQSYFDSLDFSLVDRKSLAETLRTKLVENGMLTPEVEAVLASGGTMPPSEASVSSPSAPTGGEVAEKYPPEKVVFGEGEKTTLAAQIMEELKAPAAAVMAPALLELMRHEESPVNHAALVARARSYMEYFLSQQDYE